MKKFLLAITCLLLLNTPIYIQAIGNNSIDLYNYYHTSKRYAPTKMHQGAFGAIDLDSAYVVKYNPPIYIIAYNSYIVDTNTKKITGPNRGVEKYNYDTKETYYYDQRKGDFVYYKPFNKFQKAIVNRLFFKLYNIPFYDK